MLAAVEYVEDDPSDHMTPGICRQCGKPSDLCCAHCGSADTDTDREFESEPGGQAERWRKLLLHVAQQTKRDARYQIEVILIATGDHAAEGVSMSDFARRWRVTRAAVSKHCVAICAFLKIEPSAAMRSEAARESYRQSNIRPLKIE